MGPNHRLSREFVWLDTTPLIVYHYSDGLPPAWFISDHLGTTRMLIANDWRVLWQAEYEPFGRASVSINLIGNDFRFPGQYYDSESGLHYNWNRYYDPGTGRYMTPDPIGLDGGMNLYGYVEGDPVNYYDPYGLYSWMEFLTDASNFSAGFGDTITFRGTAWIRDQWNEAFGWGDSVDPCSGTYTSGKWLGYTWGVGFGANSLRGFRWMKNARGFEKAWSKDFRTGWHRLPKGNYPGAGRNLPHYHRRPGIGKHRPWEGGW